jgi:hypothetical protein
MAYVAHHPPYRAPALRGDTWQRTRSGASRITGQQVTSFVFGMVVILTSLVFLVPMLIWG